MAKSINNQLLKVIESLPCRTFPVEISNPQTDANGCEYGLLAAHPSRRWRYCLMDSHNGPDVNPTLLELESLPASVLLGIARDAVSAEFSRLRKEYRNCFFIREINKWSDRVLENIDRFIHVDSCTPKEAASRFIFETLCSAYGRTVITDNTKVILDPIKTEIRSPYTLKADEFSGLTNDVALNIEALSVNSGHSGYLEIQTYVSGDDGRLVPDIILKADSRSVTPKGADYPTGVARVFPDESLFLLERHVNAVFNKG